MARNRTSVRMVTTMSRIKEKTAACPMSRKRNPRRST